MAGKREKNEATAGGKEFAEHDKRKDETERLSSACRMEIALIMDRCIGSNRSIALRLNSSFRVRRNFVGYVGDGIVGQMRIFGAVWVFCLGSDGVGMCDV